MNSSATGTSIYAYDGDNVVEELDSAGNPAARYAQGLGIDEPLAMYRGGVASYYHADGLGSITTLTDGAGAVAASYVYDSFGNLSSSTGTLTNSFRYTAREFDSETGLYYYRARYYDASIGRFLSEDPIRFDGGLNFYEYADTNPVGFNDPFGLAAMVFDRASGTLSLYSGSGRYVGTYGVPGGNEVETFEAGNFTTNPGGNPSTIGCNCPAPNGTYPVLKPINTGDDPRYGPYFFPIGAPGSVIRRRGIGLHGGRRGPRSRTLGCIRVSNTTIKLLYDYNKIDPIILITIQ